MSSTTANPAQVAADVDPLTLAVVAGAFDAAIREMAVTIVRTARSNILTAARDFSNCFFDPQARLIAQGDDIPAFVGTMTDGAKAVIAYIGDEVSPGDVWFCNDPRFEGAHLPDMAMYRPIFADGELLFWAVTKAHMMDTGGPVPGGFNPNARDVYAEGIRISPIKLYDAGKRRDDIFDLLLANVRLPRAMQGDLLSQLAAGEIAARRVGEMVQRHGAGVVRHCCDQLLDRAERLMRRELDAIPDGVYRGRGVVEEHRDGLQDARIDVELTVRGSEIDFVVSGPPQTDNYFNAYRPMTRSMVYYGLLVMLDPSLPHNDGLYRPVGIDFGPEGTRVNAAYPAACGEGNGSVADAVWDAVSEALSVALPDRACGGWCRPYASILSGTNPKTGEGWSDFSLGGAMGGSGAAWKQDGWDAIGWVNTGGALQHGDVELLEYSEPIRIWRHEIQTDSAGPGEWRGGMGIEFEVELLADAEITTIADGTKYAPAGRLQAAQELIPARLHAKWLVDETGSTQEVIPNTTIVGAPGERLRSKAPGGGGVGDPLNRDHDAVRRDVEEGLVSAERARIDYGVVIDPATGQVDADATQALRA